MSSVYVRDQLLQFIQANAPSETVVDLSTQYGEFKEMLIDSGVAVDAPWLGIEFIPYDEEPITILSTNTDGKYRETGAIYFHLCDIAGPNVGASLLTRGETLRTLLRGQRIGRMVVEGVTPVTFGRGTTLEFEGGYMSGSFFVYYECDLDL